MEIKFIEEEDEFSFNISDFVSSLSEESVKRLIELLTWDKLLPQIQEHITGDSEFWSVCTDGTRKGRKIREAILETQGVVPEYKKDLEHEAETYKREAEHYKKYYDWYFRFYHADYEVNRRIVKSLGEPN